ncbi:MAG: SRPBCC family protein [Archangium sp.]|nr:SRPBCC family protein [Archangium sp.]
MTFELEQWVNGPIDAVYALLSDPSRLSVLHPLIEQVTVTHRDETRVEVDLFEHVPMGPFRIPNAYRATYFVHPEAPRRLRARGESFPKVVIDAEYTLEQQGERTRVSERTTVSALLGLKGFVARTAREAHRKQLANLSEYFDALPRTAAGVLPR